MEVAKQHGLVFNSEKCELKVPRIKFFGMMYDKGCVHPDLAKVNDIQQRSSPESNTELQEFLGMVTYMSPFIPKLAEHTVHRIYEISSRRGSILSGQSHTSEISKRIKGLSVTKPP